MNTVQVTSHKLQVTSHKAVVICVVATVAFLLPLASASAQTNDFMLRGSVDFGAMRFTAKQSFNAVLGSETGRVFGGGVEVVLPQRVFAGLRVSRFQKSGERVFLFNNERFNLGIPMTVSITPVQLTGGYRFDYGRRLVPYAAAGMGWYRYEETSDFAETLEQVDERFRGYHLLTGIEIRIASWIGTAVESEWATVPNALGTDPNSVSGEFNESNLGGLTVRVRVVVGR